MAQRKWFTLDRHEHATQAMYQSVSKDIRDDLISALAWAEDTLTTYEGEGHCFHLIATSDACFMCSFAKPEWRGDHCGRKMEEAPEAIVMAVCEYLSGY